MAALILGMTSLGSIFLGFFRDRLLAGKFGAGQELDIYYAAFRIPDFISMVLIMGAISAAIIPVFTFYWTKDEKEAKKFIANLLNLLLLTLIVVSSFLFIFAPQLVSLIAPGFGESQRETTVLLTRIMFLSPILLGISNIISGVLQIFSRFFVTALAPIMYNLGIIFGILVFVPRIGLSGLAWGVVLGGFLHLLIQLPIFLYLGFRFKRRTVLQLFSRKKDEKISFFHPGIKKVFRLMIPRFFGLAASQINLIVITAIASTLAVGSIAVFNLANNLNRSLLILLAVPFSTAVFPALSMSFSKGQREEFMRKFSLSFRLLSFLIIPGSALLFILRAQIVRIVFGTGQFGWVDTRLTSACLALFSLSLFAYGLATLLSKTFYALRNTKTPAMISLIVVTLNIGFSLFFVEVLKTSNFFTIFLIDILKLQGLEEISIIGLPLAFSISGVLQFLLLFYFLWKQIGGARIKEIAQTFQKACMATLLMLGVAYFSLRFFDLFFDTSRFVGIFLQTAGAAIIAILSYFLISFLLKSSEINLLKKFLFSRLSRN